MGDRNDQWSYFGNKSVKSKMHELERNNLVLWIEETKDEDAKQLMQTNLDNIQNTINRYDREQKIIQAKAIDEDLFFELARRKYKLLGIASLVTSISVLAFFFAAVVGLSESRGIRILCIVLAVMGLIISLYGTRCQGCFPFNSDLKADLMSLELK